MNEKLGIPYMGSKRKLAPEILKCITQRHPNLTDFYDLFGGGGSGIAGNGKRLCAVPNKLHKYLI